MLCRAHLLFKQLMGVIDSPSPADIERVAAGAVRTFLRAHAVGESRCDAA